MGDSLAIEKKRKSSNSVGSGCPPLSVVTNQRAALRQALTASGIQAKFAVGAADDRYEREADRVADQVVAQDVGASVNGSSGTKPSSSIGEGVLPQALQAGFEDSFGRDFSAVRLHSGAQAARGADAIGARAYTQGRNIFFNQGEYAPDSRQGQRLIAHELTHVAQQGQAPLKGNIVSAPQVSTSASPDVAQRDFLDTLGFVGRQALEGGYDLLNGEMPNPIDSVFDSVVATNIAMATEIDIPDAWREAAVEYAVSDVTDGAVLLAALARFPSYYRGGWIMDLQPDAAAMTLDHSIFVPDGETLSLKTYVHELVHVMQYGVLDPTAFLVSYFGLSGATIAYRWAAGEPLNPMRSSPHENEAYELANRFATWYNSAHGSDPSSITV
ncbi:DUF4157 domain-containing protein [Pseudomonadota bacterium]